MKKGFLIITFFLLFFSNYIYVKAEDIYLDDLKILNGINTLSFDKMNDLYTIIVKEDILSLDIDYKVDPNIDVTIVGNDNLEFGVNDVYINLKENNNTNHYHLIVTREYENEYVFKEIKEENTDRTNQYTIPCLAGGWFISNIVVAYFLFWRRKH